MRSLDFYRRILPVARDTARRIGCRGARWPKMVGPEGRESPNWISPFLTWQQPHPIHFAELMFQAQPTRATLNFFATSFLKAPSLWRRSPGGTPSENAMNWGRRLSRRTKIISRIGAPRKIRPSTWRIGRGRWAWRKSGARDLVWRRAPTGSTSVKNLAPLAVRDGIYREIEEVDAGLNGHPTMLGALGVTPQTPLVDKAVMQKTLNYVLEKWPRGDTWGWDYPMMAMTAARLGRPDQAIQSLFIETPKNLYLANGHNFQQQGVLPLYLPGNGGLLFAAAMMAAGWDDAPSRHAPGFPTPENGWTVRYENLRRAL